MKNKKIYYSALSSISIVGIAIYFLNDSEEPNLLLIGSCIAIILSFGYLWVHFFKKIKKDSFFLETLSEKSKQTKGTSIVKKLLYSLLIIVCGLWVMSYFDVFDLHKFSSAFQVFIVIISTILFLLIVREKSKELKINKN